MLNATCILRPHKVLVDSPIHAIVQEILHQAQGKGERKYHVKWRDTIVLRKHLGMFKKEGYTMESQRPLADDQYISLTQRAQ